jgi:transposase
LKAVMDAMSPLALETDEKDACTIGRKGVRHGGVEIITRGGRRRIWTLEQQREIVAESLGLELTPTEVARKPAISSGLFYTWRPQFMGGQTSVSPDLRRVLPGLSCPATRQPNSGEVAVALFVPTPLALPSPRPEGLIEIVLPCGVSVRVDAEVDGRALRRVLSALDSR